MTQKLLPLLVGGLVAASALGTWTPPAPGDPALPLTRLVDARRLDFLEDERGGRVLADVAARLETDGDGTRLRLAISAVGPRIDPVPGFEGVRGANRITALELRNILRDARHEVRVTGPGGPARGDLRATTWGHVPERRLRADGTLDVAARSAERFPIAAEVTTPSLATGRHTVELLIDGAARLVCSVRVTPDGGRILDLVAPDAHRKDLP